MFRSHISTTSMAPIVDKCSKKSAEINFTSVALQGSPALLYSCSFLHSTAAPANKRISTCLSVRNHYKFSANNAFVFTFLHYLSALLFPHLHQPPKCVKLGSTALAGKNLRKQQVYDIVLGGEKNPM